MNDRWTWVDQVDQVIMEPYSGYAMMARGGWALHGRPGTPGNLGISF